MSTCNASDKVYVPPQTTVSGNATTGVNFESNAPVISGLVFGGNQLVLDCNSITHTYTYGNSFSWSAPGSTRNELHVLNTGEGSKLVYSGVEPSFAIGPYSVFYFGNLTSTAHFLIKSFNGSAVTELGFTRQTIYDCDIPSG